MPLLQAFILCKEKKRETDKGASHDTGISASSSALLQFSERKKRERERERMMKVITTSAVCRDE
jgi:hypothetical protein